MARVSLRLILLCATTLCALVAAASAAGQQLLQNGGFEQGTAGWSGPSLSTAGCAPRSGQAALSAPLFAQQNLPAPIGSGTYRLDGWLKAAAGNLTVEIKLIWFDDEASALAMTSEDVTIGTAYAPFSISARSPTGARGLRVRLGSKDGAFCLDDVTLDGPGAPAATPVSTQHANATATPTSPATARPAASATPRPTATPQLAADTPENELPPSLEFTNGGFEAGLSGWSRFGGALSVVEAPVRSGTAAGRLSSATDSTKWAFQTLAVESAQHYEFSGYVSSDAGVEAAYLRVSWYASSDGSGAALATAGSTERIAGASAYAFLTTGAVQAPPDARSARTRVVLTPAGAGPASITFDDLWFGPVSAPEQPPEPSPPDDPVDVEDVAAAVVHRDTPPRVAESLPSSGGVIESTEQVSSAVASIPATAPPLVKVAPSATLPSGALAVKADKGHDVPLLWPAGAALFFACLAGSYLHAKRRPA